MTPRSPSQSDLERRRQALQDRILPVPLIADGTPKQLYKEITSHLIRAVSHEQLMDSIAHIKSHVQLQQDGDSFTIYGARLGRTNFKRSRALPHFTRTDGAWFDFLIAGQCRSTNTMELMAYDCEIRFPDSLPTLPRFVRFDLNLPGHANEAPGLRCHIHPGHDDLQAAAPFMHPLDIIDLCLHGLTWTEKLRAS